MLLVKGKLLLPIILMIVLAVSRIPGLLPQNFSAVYALVFCAGVFFPRRLVWWVPLSTMIVSDLLLNWYYHIHFNTPIVSVDLLGNYIAYAAFIWLGRWFGPKASFVSLIGGGLICAILFYLISNTISWLFNPFHNPEYTKTLAGLLTALTRGTAGYAQTWEFFRNTLTSSGLFTALFAGAMKFMDALNPAEEEEPAEDKPDEPAAEQPEEASEPQPSHPA